MTTIFTDGRNTYTTSDLVFKALESVAYYDYGDMESCEQAQREANERTITNLLNAFARLLELLSEREITTPQDILEVLGHPYKITVRIEEQP